MTRQFGMGVSGTYLQAFGTRESAIAYARAMIVAYGSKPHLHTVRIPGNEAEYVITDATDYAPPHQLARESVS